MISRERWTQRAVVCISAVALAVAAEASCVGQEPSVLCAEGEKDRMVCPGPGGAGAPPLCVDPTTDSQNCGACGTLCAPGQYCSASACAHPTSCADLSTHAGPATDGDYVIQPVGRAAFTVYCAGMSTKTPKEYLTLLHTNGNGATASNVSAYNCSNCADSARQYFEKVRIDPATLLVTLDDTTFTTFLTNDYTCWAHIGGACASALTLGFAQAGNCILNGMPTPGNVDLRGTPFSIDPSVSMSLSGDSTYGTSTFSPDRKVLNFSGGGDCGASAPANGMFLLKQD